jgi:hypothetical protein
MSAPTDQPASRGLARIATVVLAVAVVLNTASIIVAFENNANTNARLCRSVHKIVVVGSQIIDGGPRLRNQLKLHLISRAQYAEGLRQTQVALRKWRSADCPPGVVSP